eukprot:g8016.t1
MGRQGAASKKKTQKQEEEAAAAAAQRVADTSTFFETGNVLERRREWKLSTLLTECARSTASKFFARDQFDVVQYSTSADGTTAQQMFWGNHLKGKLRIFAHLMLTLACITFSCGDPEYTGTVDLPAHTVIYPNNANFGEVKKDRVSAFRGFSEAYEVADQVWATHRPDEFFEIFSSATVQIFSLKTDSGGSTINTLFWMGSLFLSTELAKKVIYWPDRCKNHQAALVAKSTADMYLQLVGLDPAEWQKRTYLQAFSLLSYCDAPSSG